MRPLHYRVKGMTTACGKDVYKLVSTKATATLADTTCTKCLEAVEKNK